MKRSLIRIILYLFVGFPFIIQAQQKYHDPKQTNENGKDVMADAPWRMKKTDDLGNLNGIPIHVFIKDADGLGSNAELIYINICIKNASDTLFGDTLTFEMYTDSAFLSLFSSKSVTDAALDIQSFDESLPVKDSSYTIQFTANDCTWPDECQYVDITHTFWYFTITIPPEKLAGFEDIIDIHVYFSLNWDPDDGSYLRVFRYDDAFPELPGWYRGDAHYHTMYTNNSAEFGLPLEATKEIAKTTGFDWISSTNHSCDYDNYGTGMKNNWNREDSEIQSLNAKDSSMIFIHGMEASVKNSEGNLIHMLCYPNNLLPYSMPYVGDGNGDITATSVTIDDLLDSLTKYDGFSYAAHPFAGQDKLSSLIGGGIWNVSDADFPANGSSIAGHDVVICNTTTSPSDLFSLNNSQEVFKNRLQGGQIWNYRNALKTTDESFNPWNDTYDSGVTPFVPYDSTDTYYHYNRLLQNFEVAKFLNIKGLKLKNSDNNLQNYRFYISAGSDAHGDFNYSNTNFVYGVTLDISDAAIGNPSAMVYCPYGMGPNGENVLKAMKKGNVIMSDGPLIVAGLDLNNDGQDEYICGDEALPDAWQYMDARVHIQIANTPEFGNIEKCKLIFGTQNGEHTFLLNIPQGTLNEDILLSLDSLVSEMEAYDTIQDLEYFYFRPEIQTHKNFNSLSVIYRDTAQDYHAFSNPVWIKKPAVVVGNNDMQSDPEINCYPNPFKDELTIILNLEKPSNVICEIADVTGRVVYKSIAMDFPEGENIGKINTEFLSKGIYILQMTVNNFQKNRKIIKLDDR
jgi:hypothetical protein